MSEAAELIHLCLDTSRQFKTNLKRLLLTYTEVKPVSFLIQVVMRMILMAFPVLGLVWFHHSFFPLTCNIRLKRDMTALKMQMECITKKTRLNPQSIIHF